MVGRICEDVGVIGYKSCARVAFVISNDEFDVLAARQSIAKE
jgi:hypothetical protein